VIGEQELAYALREARAVADHTSRCVRRKVGAVLFDREGKFLSYGANINPPQQPCDEGFCPRGLKSMEEVPAYAPYVDCTATHAEVVAVRLARERLGASGWLADRPFGVLTGGTLVVTDKPCDQCAAYLTPFHLNIYWPEGRVLS
jgi:deoxycytidylate deaminase